jgi:hypothetical protein
MQQLTCSHCGAANVVAVCSRCERAFVISERRITEGMRQTADAPWKEPSGLEVQPCDFCVSKDMKEALTVRVDRGLRQRTCPACNKEFLSAHGLKK